MTVSTQNIASLSLNLSINSFIHDVITLFFLLHFVIIIFLFLLHSFWILVWSWCVGMYESAHHGEFGLNFCWFSRSWISDLVVWCFVRCCCCCCQTYPLLLFKLACPPKPTLASIKIQPLCHQNLFLFLWKMTKQSIN